MMEMIKPMSPSVLYYLLLWSKKHLRFSAIQVVWAYLTNWPILPNPVKTKDPLIKLNIILFKYKSMAIVINWIFADIPK